MQNILITGSRGQLGNELKEIASQYDEYQFYYTDVEDLDVSQKPDIEAYIVRHSIDVIINCAAYTAVDKAEDEPEMAMKINAFAVENLAQLCAMKDIFLVHISTDYVFDGKNYLPYREDAQPAPLSVYAHSKFEGEQHFLKSKCRGALIRTSWLYSSFGNNFVKTMIRLGKEREALKVVYDQVGTPTYAKDLALAVMQLIKHREKVPGSGIYHFSNEGVASWYDFAYQIMQLEHLDCDVKAITTQEYPLPAQRPHYSLMDKSKIKKLLNLDIRHWTAALKECLKNIKS